MKNSRVFALILCALVMTGCGTEKSVHSSLNSPNLVKAGKIGILVFAVESNIPEGMGQGIADELTARLTAKGYHVIERGDLSKVLSEQNLQKDAKFDTDMACRAGKMAGADYVVLGSVQTYVLSGTMFTTYGQATFYARMVNVETGAVMWTARETVRSSYFEIWGLGKAACVLDDLVVQAGERLTEGL